MMVSPYGRTTCALQVVTLLAVGAGVSALAWRLSGQPALALLGLAPVAFALFVLSFYRDPDRTGPDDPDALWSPADGTVTDVVEVDEPHYLEGRALRVGIFLSPLNVHVNRASLAGTVERVVRQPGKCLPATSDRCIDANEAALLGLRSDAGLRYALRQVTGALARTIVCAAEVGDRLERGQRYGMIKLGSRTELLVPIEAGFVPEVQPGDTVRGGQTVLGRVSSLAGAANKGGGAGAAAAASEGGGAGAAAAESAGTRP